MKLALKWEVPRKEGLQNWAHEESQTQRTHQLTLNMKNKNWLLRWRGATEGKIDVGRKGLAKWVNVKMRYNKGEVFLQSKWMGISSEGYRRTTKKVKLQMKRSFRGENMKDPKEDAVDQQMNGTLYFTNFKWKKKSLPIHIADNRRI